MTTVNLEVPEEIAEDIVQDLNEKAQAMENTLQSYRSNGLAHLDSYQDLMEEQKEVVQYAEEAEEQLETEWEDSDGITELFG